MTACLDSFLTYIETQVVNTYRPYFTIYSLFV